MTDKDREIIHMNFPPDAEPQDFSLLGLPGDHPEVLAAVIEGEDLDATWVGDDPEDEE